MAANSGDFHDLLDGYDDKFAISSLPQKSNALSNKLASVLSASYADVEIREALGTLDAKDTRNSPETRRKLRLDVQKDVLDCNGGIVKEFGHVAEVSSIPAAFVVPSAEKHQQLKRIGSTIASLNKCCEEMRQHVVSARQENAPVLEDASALLVQKRDLESKQQLLEAFNKHFVISEENLIVLTDISEVVDDKFFIALKRVKQIHTDCQILLGNENQRLGLELMDQSSRNLNSAYQKLYRWIQREFKTLNLENPRISSIIRRALRALAERPTLFQSCLDFFAEAREHVLTDAFYSALTGSSADGEQNPITKPIEFYAHDPLRYVGDMLAWTHSTTVSEREALESLFISDGDEIAKGIQAGRDSEPWSTIDDEAFDGRKALGALVNRNLAGVARAIRQRVEQAIQNHEGPVLTYKIANLINFYRLTFTRLLGADSSILETLSALEESALRQFRSIMKDHVTSIQADLSLQPPNLYAPDFLNEALIQLTALLKTYDSALIPAPSKDADFQPILAVALTPFLSASETLGKKIDPPSSEIFLANCLLAAKTTLAPYDFVTAQLSSIDTELETHISTLISHQHAFFLHTSGLHPLVAALASFAGLQTPDDSLLTIPSLAPFQPDFLSTTSQSLDAFLPSALMDATENLKELGSTKLAAEITAEAANRFCADFEFVEAKLAAVDRLLEPEEDGDQDGEREGWVPLRAIFPRTSGEIRVLLS